MTQVMYPIVQAEFMAWGDGAELDDILSKGAFKKVTFRIFDDDGSLSRTIRRSAAAAEALNSLMKLAGLYPERPYTAENIIPRITSAMNVLAEIKQALHGKVAHFVIERIEDAVRKECAVAVENEDRTFRTAKDSEIQHIVKVAVKAKGAYFFLFPPNTDLLANTHQSVISSMG